MELYSLVLNSLIYTMDIISNIFGGTKPIYARLENYSQLLKIFNKLVFFCFIYLLEW